MTEKNPILILALLEDPHVNAVVDILESRQQPYIKYRFSQFPTQSRFGVEISDSDFKTSLEIEGKAAPTNFHSVWYRRPGEFKASGSLATDLHDYIKLESILFFRQMQYLFPDAFFVSDPIKGLQTAPKIYQLQLAKMLGLKIPHTCLGNHPEAARPLFDQYPDLIVKAVQNGSYIRNLTFLEKIKKQFWDLFHPGASETLCGGYEVRKMMPTQKISAEQREAILSSLPVAPVALQNFIPKKLELRITVVGKKIFPCAIYSQDNPNAAVDWRGAEELVRHEVYQLPPDIEQKCFELVKRLGLQFGCIDMVVTPDDEYVFLEINANGQWYWIQDKTGMPIAEAIADLLMTRDGL